jgi:excisionase family DNA binding protein
MTEPKIPPGAMPLPAVVSLVPGVVNNPANPAILNDRLLTAAEAAAELRLHPVTILRWAREGRIPHRRLGRKVVFPLSLLNSWLESGYTDSAVRAA